MLTVGQEGGDQPPLTHDLAVSFRFDHGLDVVRQRELDLDRELWVLRSKH